MKKILVSALILVSLVACTGTKHHGKHHTGFSSDEKHSVILNHESEIAKNISDRIYFAFDSAVLDENAKEVLIKQAEWIKSNNVTVTLEGHCDTRGPRDYNLGLGERRANAVKNFLIAHKVDNDKVKIISYGKERPAALGNTSEAHSLNRRSVTVINK